MERSEYKRKLGAAIALASEVHKDQLDKSGKAYILHPLAVMERATTYYLARSDGWQLEIVQIVAVLHDVLEDIKSESGWERTRLASRIYDEFGSTVSGAVDALTKQTFYSGEGNCKESYDDYLGRVSRDWIARLVKIADLSHNLDAFRMPTGKIRESDFARWDKYHRALVFLTKEEATARV